MALFGCPLLLTLLAISGTVALDCYSCSGAQKPRECKLLDTCDEGQVCYKKREFTDDVRLDLGCIDAEKCGDFSEVAKMSADKTSSCFECCSKDKCNKDLCEYPPHKTCHDDESFDCARLNSLFNICNITTQAKKMCPRFCKLCNLVDGKWSLWSPWSSCDVTCGKGTLSRHRLCNNPEPQNGGLDCPGKGTELKACILKLCPVHGGWSVWENWGKCSAICGVGMRSRKRSCTDPRPQRFGDHCFGDSTNDDLCNSKPCEVKGSWNDWSNWGQCSISCGVGLQSRTRSCTNEIQGTSGYNCIGSNKEDKLCYTKLCEGVWGLWEAWGKCSANCGPGVQTRKRKCTKQLFTGFCKGNETDVKACERIRCRTDCSDIRENSHKERTGVYNVTLWKSKQTISVYCDFDTDNGGWTVFQYRFNGKLNFHRNFAEYKLGFGNLNNEFWLGLDYLHEMVSQGKLELRLDLTATDGKKAYETFQNFRIDHDPYYTLRIDRGLGTAGDSSSGLSYHNGQKFSTYDNDQDNYGINCAATRGGGWWYNACYNVNLNGKYSEHNRYYSFNNNKPLKFSRMMFRRV